MSDERARGYRAAAGVLRGAIPPGDTPEAAIRRGRGDVDAYEERIAQLTRDRALLLAYARAEARHRMACTRYTARVLTEARDALVAAGLLDEDNHD